MREIKSAKSIGMKIRERRKELGMSQERLAEALNVSYQQVQRYENGANMLNTEKLQLVAKSLAVPVGFFFDEEAGMTAGEAVSPYLPADEVKILSLFRRMEDRYRKAILLLMELAAGKK